MKRKNLYVTCTAFIAAFAAYTFASFSNPTDKAHEPSVLTNALLLIDNSFTDINEDELALAGDNESQPDDSTDSASNSEELSSTEDEVLLTVAALTQEQVTSIENESNKTKEDESETQSKVKARTAESSSEEEDDDKETVDSKTKLSIANKLCDVEDIAISVATSYVNIREKANTDSNILGKLYNKNAAHILKTEGDWLYISSGNVEGYVKAEYVISGLTEEELAEYGTIVAKVTADGLNVRETASTEAKRVDVIYNGESYPVIKIKDDWVKLNLEDDGVKGYVLSEYVELNMTFTEAISIAEENALKKAEEEKKAEEAQKANQQTQTTSTTTKSSQKIETVYGSSTDYSKDELKLLACLVHAEAGNQSYEGKLAVANVVLNRVRSGKYPNSIYDVIYQKSQFSVASSGSLQKQLNLYSQYNTSSQKLSIQAAKDALNGVNNVGKRLYFNRYSKKVANAHSSNGVKIDDQYFW